MSKKLLNKVISAILVLAICSTAFLGGVVSAETTETIEATVEVKGSEYAMAAEEVSATVTLSTEEDKFIAGIFSLDVAEGLTFKSAEVTEVTYTTETAPAENVTVGYPNVDWSTDGDKFIFQGWDDEDLKTYYQYTSLKILFTFTATDLEAGGNYAVTVSDVDVTDINENESSVEGATDNIHIHKYDKDEENSGEDVTAYKCACGASKQDTVANKKADEIETTDEALNADGYFITFAPNGDLILNYLLDGEVDNIHLAVIEDGVIKQLIESSGLYKGFNTFQVTWVGGVQTIGQAKETAFVKVVDGTFNAKSVESTVKSIADYCEDVLAGEFDQVDKDYCKALLNYAAATQLYADPEATDLVNKNYKEDYEDTVLVKNESNSYSTASTDGNVKLRGGNVSLSSKPAIRLYLTINDIEDMSKLVFNIETPGGILNVSADTLKTTKVSGKSYYYVDVENIPAKGLRTPITIAATYNETDIGMSGGYSAEAFAASKVGKGTQIEEVSRIMIAYSDKLLAKFGA